MSDVLELAKALIAKASITPDDQGCQALITEHLQRCGFTVEAMPFNDVKNLWARKGNQAPLICFAGHTDVVPPGPIEHWQSDPFMPTIRNGVLYGRGAADMKGSLAAMVCACERFVKAHPNHQGSIALLITSDEEGMSIDGTKRVIETLQQRNENIDYCVVGEATCSEKFGDTIKVGRRGSLSGNLTIYGTQGHVAYPALAENPIHKFAPALTELTQHRIDDGDEFFAASSLQFSNIHAGTGANNVIPGELTVAFNIRYSPATNAETLIKFVEDTLDKHGLNYKLDWHHSGGPYLSNPGTLSKALRTVIEEHLAVTADFSTSGGTSDGRFIANMDCEVIEFGPVNKTIHKVDECVNVHELEQLSLIYEGLLIKLLAN